MNERDEQGAFTETQVNRICEVIQAGFILIAAKLDLQRNTGSVNISTEVALKSATDLMNKLRNRSETSMQWTGSIRTQPMSLHQGQGPQKNHWNERA